MCKRYYEFLKSLMGWFFMSILLVVDLITGSTMIGTFNFFKFWYNVLIISELYTMPIFIPSILKSEIIVSNWFCRIFFDTGSTMPKFVVFCPVIAVITVNPWTSNVENVLMSLWIPAPDDGSELSYW